MPAPVSPEYEIVAATGSTVATWTASTWMVARENLAKAKIARGFPVKPAKIDLSSIRSRTKCFHCGKVGRFKKDCPDKKKGDNATDGPQQHLAGG